MRCALAFLLAMPSPAASQVYPDIILIEHGANLNATTYDGSAPLHVATSYRKPDRAHVVQPRGTQELQISIVPRQDDWHHCCHIERGPATVTVEHKFELAWLNTPGKKFSKPKGNSQADGYTSVSF
jgi:hypothetical protein